MEESLIAAGEDDSDPTFDAKVRQRIDDDLTAMTGGKAPQDFVRVIQTIFELKQKGDVAEAGALISWLCGSGNVAPRPRRPPGSRGTSAAALRSTTCGGYSRSLRPPDTRDSSSSSTRPRPSCGCARTHGTN